MRPGPWKVYGEGPSTNLRRRGQFDGQTDVSKQPFTAEDIRFTQSKDGKTLYAIVLEIPKDGKVTVKSLASGSDQLAGQDRQRPAGRRQQVEVHAR